MPDPDTPPPAGGSPEAPRSASFLRVLGVVFSSFLGIRKKASGERDMVTIKPLHVIIAGLIGAAIFVGVLVALVSYITRNT